VNLHLSISFRMEPLLWERKFKLELHRNQIWHRDWYRILKCKYLHRKRNFRLAFLKWWPYENEGFDIISIRYTIKFTETVYESKAKTEIWKGSLNVEIGNPIWRFGIVVLSKMRTSPSFQNATRLNSTNQYMKLGFRMKFET